MFKYYLVLLLGYSVVQSVVALFYKPEGRGFEVVALFYKPEDCGFDS
jgi:hypothetical protein